MAGSLCPLSRVNSDRNDMKLNVREVIGLGLLVVGSLQYASGAIYYGPAYGNDNSPALSGGKLELSTGTDGAISGVFSKGVWTIQPDQSVVFYIDSLSGGFHDTSSFTTVGNALQNAAAGTGKNSEKSLVTFASGFEADYAIVLKPSATYAYLFKVVSPGTFDAGTRITATEAAYKGGADSTYTFKLNWSDLGLVKGDSANSFKFAGTFINETAYRYKQSLESYQTRSEGRSGITFTSYDTFVAPVPEPVNVALGVFGGLFGVVGIWRRIHR